tara:strand:- start:1848 stop:2003 length:156 start_codon:yes stop_codon:yes gene_type:complete
MTAEQKLRKYIIKKYGEIDYGKTEKNIKDFGNYVESLLETRVEKSKLSKDI